MGLWLPLNSNQSMADCTAVKVRIGAAPRRAFLVSSKHRLQRWPSMSDIDALIATATRILKHQPQQTMEFTFLCCALHSELGKPRCRAAMKEAGGAMGCFVGNSAFRLQSQDGKTHRITLVGSKQQTMMRSDASTPDFQDLVASATRILEQQPEQAMGFTSLCVALHEELGKEACREAIKQAGGGAAKCFERQSDTFHLEPDGSTYRITLVGSAWHTVASDKHRSKQAEAPTPAAPDPSRKRALKECRFIVSSAEQHDTLRALGVTSLDAVFRRALSLCTDNPPNSRRSPATSNVGLAVYKRDLFAFCQREIPPIYLLLSDAIDQGEVIAGGKEPHEWVALPATEPPSIATDGETEGLVLQSAQEPAWIQEARFDDPMTAALNSILYTDGDRPVEAVMRHSAMGMLYVRTEMIKLERRAEAAEARVAQLEDELRRERERNQRGLQLANEQLEERRLLASLLETAGRPIESE